MKESTIRLVLANLFLWTAAIPDIRTKKIPVWLPGIFMAAALVADLFVPSCLHRQELLAGAVPGVLLFLLSFSGKGKIGEGDGICLLICGLFTGITQAVLIMGTAFFLAAEVGAACLVTKRLHAKDRIPFLPFLAASSSLLLMCAVMNAGELM